MNILPISIINGISWSSILFSVSSDFLSRINPTKSIILSKIQKTEYINIELLEKEVIEAKKICLKNKWATIDVTKKSIEEVAATVLEYYKIFQRRNNDK